MHVRVIPVLALWGLAGVWAARGADAPPRPVSPEEVATLIRQAKPAKPMSWTQIPWAGTLLEARQAGGREKCPVFLFTLDGNIATGRC